MVTRYQQDGKVSWVLMGNGGINSTQEDMFKWYLALRSNKVLSKSATKKLTTPYILEYEGETSYYAYGWVIFKTPRETNMVAHDGSNATFFYDFRWLPEEDVAILYATPSFTRNIGGMAWRVDKMFFDETYTPKAVEVDFVSTLLDFAYHYKGAPNELASSIKNKFGDKLDKPFYLNRLGGILSRNNQLDKAILVAELNIKLFPKDSNIWDSLGQIYYANGNKTEALNAYKKAFALDSENSYAKDMVTKLESKNK
jgi:tetratricopeptide (TPR) repeat protein